MPDVWHVLGSVRRLDFRQPSFSRIAWVSDSARRAWEPAIQQIVRVRSRIFAEAVLEVPLCCRIFRHQVHEILGMTDSTLPRALNTPGAAFSDRVVRLPVQPLLNTLLVRLGIDLLSHEPCSMSCGASHRAAATWIQTGRHLGYTAEMDSLEEILSWPVEWSALHGIAEIKTPVAKISTNTDTTAETYRVQLLSDRQPVEALPGLRFPFQQPRLVRIAGGPTGASPIAKPTPYAGAPPVRQNPRSSAILDETLERIRGRVAIDRRRIQSIYLSNYFNVIQLDDGSTGAAMNYCRFKSDAATRLTLAWLNTKLDRDPLLLSYLFPSDEPDLLQLSLKTCLVSALSKKLLCEPVGFQSRTRFDPAFFPDVQSAVVIGFGGYMDYLILKTDIERIHVCDLQYPQRARSMEKRLARYRELFSRKTITISNGFDAREQIAGAQLVSITGSAFSTGTMETILDAARDCEAVIVQGQSAAIYPAALFDRGVTLLSTTIKPDNLVDIANSDQTRFRALLEGKLPPRYFLVDRS